MRLRVVDQVQITGDTASGLDSELIDARNRFFPGWWTYAHLGEPEHGGRPFYRVVCHSPDECELVRRARPSYIRAEIVKSW